MPPADVQIIPVETESQRREFLGFPYQLYKQDPRWTPPLRFEQKGRLSFKKNPYFDHAHAQLFLAKQEGRVVGRISSQIDQNYEKSYGEKVGHFGFLEMEEDLEIAKALFQAAEKYFRQQGIRKILGPFSYSINEESGILVEGFQEASMLMTPYNPSYYGKFIEACGYQKAKDLLAWRYEVNKTPQDALEIAAEVKKHPDLNIRSVNPRRLKKDLHTMIEVFNSAWKNNWGFIPMTPREVAHLAENLKIILDPVLAFLIEIKGETAGICLATPNVNEIIGDLNGKLFPLGWAKFLWRLKTQRFRSGRLMLLGVKEKFRTFSMGGLSILLYAEIARRAQSRGYEWAELSWTLEDNDRINDGIKFMQGKVYKRLRVYEKELGDC